MVFILFYSFTFLETIKYSVYSKKNKVMFIFKYIIEVSWMLPNLFYFKDIYAVKHVDPDSKKSDSVQAVPVDQFN